MQLFKLQTDRSWPHGPALYGLTMTQRHAAGSWLCSPGARLTLRLRKRKPSAEAPLTACETSAASPSAPNCN